MKLNELHLTKEELPILHGKCFRIPIHPIFLDPNIKINPELISKSFAKTPQGWHEDLKDYKKTAKLEEGTEGWYDLFLKDIPQITEEYGIQKLSVRGWENHHQLAENGFCTHFGISRNYGGSLFFHDKDPNCKDYIFFKSGPSRYVLFPRKKAKEFNVNPDSNIIIANVYSSHNIDDYPGALFLRNWAINYINMALEDILKST